MKVFITGASGFVGRNLLNELSPLGWGIVCLSRKAHSQETQNIRWVQGELNEPERWKNYLPDVDCFIHLAGEVKDESAMQKTNVEAVQTVCNLLKEFPRIKLLHLSSAGVYGIHHHPHIIISEDSGCFPENLYEKTKREAELLIESNFISSPRRYVMLRPTNIFGNDDERKKLLNMCRAIQSGKFFLLRGNSVMNYVHISFVTSAIKKIVTQALFSNSIYNLNQPMEISKFTSALCSGASLIYPQKIPTVLIPLIRLYSYFTTVFIFLPKLITPTRFRELMNRRTISGERFSQFAPQDSMPSVEKGLEQLASFYKKQNWF